MPDGKEARDKGKNLRDARQGAARLRGLGKLVPAGRSDEERLREAQQALRSEDAYADAAECRACAAARQSSRDAGALCEPHLRHAMGL